MCTKSEAYNFIWTLESRQHLDVTADKFNPLMATVAIWVQLQSILCQTGLRSHL